MASNSRIYWSTTRVIRLDEMEEAHRSVGGTGRGRRTATQQLNHAYTLLLASQFQGFCRNLHTETATAIALSLTPSASRMYKVLLKEFTFNRKLDGGNANPGNIGSDFNRFGIDFWAMVDSLHPHGKLLRDRLDELNRWRNAIAHDNFDSVNSSGIMFLRIERVRRWRQTCQKLARVFEKALDVYLRQLIGYPPW